MEVLSDKDTLVITVALSHFANVHPRMMQALLNRYGSLEKILSVDAGSLMCIDGITADQANKISQSKDKLEDAAVYVELMVQSSISLVSRFEKHYPSRLFELNDPPSFLYYRGELPGNDNKLVAVSGTHEASIQGIELTSNVCKHLAESGVHTVTSLNSGIDAAVHLGTKGAGGKSFAVLDCGIEKIESDEDRALAADIANGGGLISEYAPDFSLLRKRYKSSNRLIAGIAQAVILTEFYETNLNTLDLLECCLQIGKMAFIIIDPKAGGLTDQASLNKAVSCGAIPMVGLEKIDDIIKSLV